MAGEASQSQEQEILGSRYADKQTGKPIWLVHGKEYSARLDAQTICYVLDKQGAIVKQERMFSEGEKSEFDRDDADRLTIRLNEATKSVEVDIGLVKRVLIF